MRHEAPFVAADLDDLDRLFSSADQVVTMRSVWDGDRGPSVIALRHDVDDNHGSLDTALELARWEHDRGYRSTFFLLHGSHYWDGVGEAAMEMVGLGHEVGLHVNAVAEALRQRRHDPHAILVEALDVLRGVVDVVGVVAHGDSLCRGLGGEVRFCNDEVFAECSRPDLGAADRSVDGVAIRPRPLSDYGLLYDANWLPRSMYLSDSGGRWSQPFETVVEGWPFAGQLHMLIHPDWWSQAFVPQPVVV